MTLVSQFKVELSGWSGGPGINTFHALAFEEGQPSQPALDDFADMLAAPFEAGKPYFVGNATCSLLPEVKVFDVGTGELRQVRKVGTWTVNTGSHITTNSRATMAKMQFVTDRVLRNRILRGGTYFGPIDDSAISPQGGIVQAAQDTLAQSWAGLIDANITAQLRLCVYSRPNALKGYEGVTGYVQQVNVMSKPAVLRSRRD
jgi:hypothetical protein